MRTWIAALSTALFVLAWAAEARLEPARLRGVMQTEPPTPYIRYPGSPGSQVVLVVHGLDSSKDTMQLISAALADAGFEVYNIDLPGHGDSRAGFEAELARKTIRQIFARLGPNTIVLGHSLGAGLLLDLAGDQHFPTMVLLSPPPLPVREVQADRVLLITGAYDVGRIRAFAPLLKDVGSPRIEWWSLPWAAHSSAIFNPAYVRRIVDWLGGDGEKVRTTARLLALGGMFIAGLALGISLLPGTDIKPLSVPLPATLVRYVAASLAAILVLKVFVPLVWLRLFATDYLISFLLLTGIALWVQHGAWPRINPTNTIKAVAAAAFVIVALGLIATSHVLHMPLSGGRWWRFPFIAAAGLPLFIVDESTIRKIQPLWLSIAAAILTRTVLWAFLITGVLLLNRDAAFLVLIAHLMVFFWVALWFGARVVHRHTQDPFAAALFSALVQGWAFAAWFVIR